MDKWKEWYKKTSEANQPKEGRGYEAGEKGFKKDNPLGNAYKSLMAKLGQPVDEREEREQK
jgi:hypothetical protein